MKQVFFTTIMALTTAGAYAQVSKGTISLEGNIGFSTTATTAAVTDAKSTQSTFFVQPGIGYFAASKLEVYVLGSFITSSGKENGKTQKGTGYGAGAGLRKYFMLHEKFAFVAGPQVYVDQRKDQLGVKTQNMEITVHAGFAFFRPAVLVFAQAWVC